MFYCVRMDVRVPHDVDKAAFEELQAEAEDRTVGPLVGQLRSELNLNGAAAAALGGQ